MPTDSAPVEGEPDVAAADQSGESVAQVARRFWTAGRTVLVILVTIGTIVTMGYGTFYYEIFAPDCSWYEPASPFPFSGPTPIWDRCVPVFGGELPYSWYTFIAACSAILLPLADLALGGDALRERWANGHTRAS